MSRMTPWYEKDNIAGGPAEVKFEVDENALENGFKGLGVVQLVIDKGIVRRVMNDEKISPQEQQELIKAYNAKLQEIKDDCENDKRCVVRADGEKAIGSSLEGKVFDPLNLFNYWIAEDDKNPNAFKK